MGLCQPRARWSVPSLRVEAGAVLRRVVALWLAHRSREPVQRARERELRAGRRSGDRLPRRGLRLKRSDLLQGLDLLVAIRLLAKLW